MPNTCYMLHILAFTHILLSFKCCMRFDVARSTTLGNAKASIRGTGNEEIPRFSV